MQTANNPAVIELQEPQHHPCMLLTGSQDYPPVSFNPLRIPRHCEPQWWHTLVCSAFCAAYDLSLYASWAFGNALWDLYRQAGVFDSAADANAVTGSVTLKGMLHNIRLKNNAPAPGRDAESTVSGQARAFGDILAALSELARDDSLESGMFAMEETPDPAAFMRQWADGWKDGTAAVYLGGLDMRFTQFLRTVLEQCINDELEEPGLCATQEQSEPQEVHKAVI